MIVIVSFRARASDSQIDIYAPPNHQVPRYARDDKSNVSL